jgi:hypothetical protein
LNPKRWGSPLVQEKYKEEKACDDDDDDDDDNNNNETEIIPISTYTAVFFQNN